MGRQPSAETLLRTAKRRIKELEQQLADAQTDATAQRQRSIRLQTERDEWKARFDALLERVPIAAEKGE